MRENANACIYIQEEEEEEEEKEGGVANTPHVFTRPSSERGS